MNKEVISTRQSISLITMLIVGSSIMFIVGSGAGNDLWIATILAIILTIPVALICARLHQLFPTNNLFDILDICFHKIISNTIKILYLCYFFYQIADISRTFSHFINTNTLRATPLVIIMISFLTICIFAVKNGIEVIARLATLFMPVYIILISISIVLLFPTINISNVLPVLDKGFSPVLKASFLTFSFPFAEIIVFSMAFSNFKEKSSSYKIYLLGLLFAGIILLIIALLNIWVLGVNEASSVFFPSQDTFGRIKFKGFFQNLEVIISITFSLSAFIKISIYLLNTCKGFSHLFKCKDYKFIVLPIALLAINTFYNLYDSILEFFTWDMEIWPYFAFPFQVIFPIIIWICAEIKKKSH